MVIAIVKKRKMFQKENLKIINADCMDIMKGYEDNYFDLAIVDPPYGINANKEKEHNGWKDYGIKEWDNEIPKPKYFKELFRVSKNQIVWGGNYMTKYLPPKMCWLLWDKGQRNFSLADGELAWTSFDKALRIFTMPRGAALSDAKKNGGKIHATQKPVKLYKWLLLNYSTKDDKIIDTHLGSGSSAIASYYFGCKEFVGIEIDEDYFNASIKRIKEQTSQIKLF